MATCDSSSLPSILQWPYARTHTLTFVPTPAVRAPLLQGFGDWTRRDPKVFIAACERFGRKQKELVISEAARCGGWGVRVHACMRVRLAGGV